MSNVDDTDDLGQRLRNALDPLRPGDAAEHRILRRFHSQVLDAASPSPRRRLHWMGHSAFGAGALGVVVAAALAGTLVLALGLRQHSATHGAQPPPTPPAPHAIIGHRAEPPDVSASPTPAPTPSVVDYVVPFSVSFPDARDGWVLGSACDTQQRCETTVARSADGGRTWQVATPPVAPVPTPPAQVSRIVAASAEDAWAWDGEGVDSGVFRDTHDGGRTWHTVDLGPTPVTAVAVADGTVWAATFCPPVFTDTPGCGVHVFVSPIHSDAWAQVSTPSVAGQASSNVFQLVRFGTRSWIVAGPPGNVAAGMARSDDGGRTWTAQTLPCRAMKGYVLAASSIDHVMLACTSIGGWPAPQEVYSSHDGGQHWTLRSRSYVQISSPEPDVGSLDNTGAPIALALTGGSTAWMANERGADLVTGDDGATWTPGALPTDVFSGAGGGEGITFADALHGWTFASAGLWATSDGGAHWSYQPIIGRVPGYQQ